MLGAYVGKQRIPAFIGDELKRHKVNDYLKCWNSEYVRHEAVSLLAGID